MMKKMLFISSLLLFSFSLSACGDNKTQTTTSTDKTATTATTYKKAEFTVADPQYSADNKNVLITGTATDGEKVRLIQDGTVLQEILVKDNTFNFSQPLSDKDHQKFEVKLGEESKTVEVKPLEAIQESSDLIEGNQSTEVTSVTKNDKTELSTESSTE